MRLRQGLLYELKTLHNCDSAPLNKRRLAMQYVIWLLQHVNATLVRESIGSTSNLSNPLLIASRAQNFTSERIRLIVIKFNSLGEGGASSKCRKLLIEVIYNLMQSYATLHPFPLPVSSLQVPVPLFSTPDSRVLLQARLHHLQ